MIKKKRRYDNHTHTHKSNINNRDSTNFESALIDRALELGLSGISITDHGCLSAHVDALLYLKKLREEANDKLDMNKHELTVENLEWHDKVNNFKLGLGTEIYLVDRKVIQEAREQNEPTKFYHLVLVAKNYEGYRALAELSSKSWEESFTFRGMTRIPTYKDYFVEWARRNKGNIICSSACLGSEFSQLVLRYIEEPSAFNRDNIINFVAVMKELFGDDFYIEIQPSHYEEQISYNRLALEIAKAYKIKAIVTTDAHYLKKEVKDIHSIYLKSQDAERETEQFYASCYLMSDEELRSYFPYLDDNTFESLLSNTIEISDKIEEYDLYKDIEVPKTKIEYLNVFQPLFQTINTSGLEYINKFINSNHLIDKILIQQIELGLRKKKIELTEEVLFRINKELGTLWKVSAKLNQRLSSYYLLTKEIIEIMWRVSLVGVSRGSAGAFYLCYLLEITQINPLDYDLPDWRHLSEERPELPDIDIDTEAGQRAMIIQLVKEYYGEDRVLNITTFKTEGTASAIQTMCRGMGISTEEASYISSLAVEGMTVKQCFDAYKENAECKALIDEMLRYEGLVENVIAIEGLCCGRSVHASGVYIFNDSYWKYNAMMKTPNGLEVTQYDMKNSDYMGGLKLD